MSATQKIKRIEESQGFFLFVTPTNQVSPPSFVNTDIYIKERVNTAAVVVVVVVVDLQIVYLCRMYY